MQYFYGTKQLQNMLLLEPRGRSLQYREQLCTRQRLNRKAYDKYHGGTIRFAKNCTRFFNSFRKFIIFNMHNCEKPHPVKVVHFVNKHKDRFLPDFRNFGSIIPFDEINLTRLDPVLH